MRAARIAASAALLLSITGGSLPALDTTASADASTLYVGKFNCSDTSASAGSQATPYCTVQAAVDVVQPGQTVRIEHGQYSGEVDVTRSGTATEPITIEGMGDDLGNLQSWINPGGTHGFVLAGISNVVIRDVVSSTTAQTVEVTDSSDVTLDQDDFYASSVQNTTTGISLLGNTHDVTVSRTQVSGYGAAGILLGSGTSNNTLTTDVLGDGFGPAVSVDGATGTAVTSNTVMDGYCGPPAVDLSGGATGTAIENNVFHRPVDPKDCTTAPPQLEVSADSTARTAADYNIVSPVAGSPAYSWAGTDYSSPADFHAATAQGAHDLSAWAGQLPREHSASIDSADADAPGELSTDLWGAPRVDDPLVADTGTGSGYVDRGAVEFQDPINAGSVTLNYDKAPVGTQINATEAPHNPWSDPISSYTFDFGDGSTPVSSATASATHTYSAGGNSYTVTATPHPADGAAVRSSSAAFYSSTDYPLQSYPDLVTPRPGTPLTVTVDTRDTWSPWDYTMTLDYGDGSAPLVTSAGELVEHTYPEPGTYTVTEKVTDVGGASLTKTMAATVGSEFVPLTPTRLLDTRDTAKVGPNSTIDIQVAGVGGVPMSGVTAVVLNVTATDATSADFVTAYAGGTSRPTASNLNITAGSTVPAMVTVPVGANGKVTLYNHSGTIDLVADLEGYYEASAAVPDGTLLKSAQGRILDTRYGTGAVKAKVQAGRTVTFTVPSALTSGATVKAVLLNVTATDASTGTYIAAYPAGSARPTTSVLNLAAGQTAANLVTVPVSSDGRVTLFNHSGSVDLIADLQGVYTSDPGGMEFMPTEPTRVLDTRSGLGAPKAELGPGQTLKLALPSGFQAPVVLLNLTVTDTTAGSYLIAYPGGQARPAVSDINFSAGQTRANAAASASGSTGGVDIYNHAGYVDVIADLQGYFTY